MKSIVKERNKVLTKKKKDTKGTIGKNKVELNIKEKRGYRLETIDLVKKSVFNQNFNTEFKI